MPPSTEHDLLAPTGDLAAVPDRMATVAALFGLSTVDPAAAVVVTGPVAVEAADVASADYVLLPGVLSWVDEHEREHVIAAAARAARSGGLVSLPFLALPGGHADGVARRVAREAVVNLDERASAASAREPTPQERAAAAVARLRLVARTAGATPHGHQMTLAADRYERLDPQRLLDELLGGTVEAFRLRHVAERCAEHGLHYVGDLLPAQLWQHRLPAKLAATVRDRAPESAIDRQQLVDDLTGTEVHASLFVKSDQPPRPDPSAEGLTVHVRQHANAATAEGMVRADAVSAPVAQVLREHDHDSVTTAEIAEELERPLADVEAAVLAMYAHELARIDLAPSSAPDPDPVS